MEPTTPEQQSRMAGVVTTLQADLARADAKASLLLALSGAALVALASTAPELHPTATATTAAALCTATLLAATALLLLAVRPDLRGNGWTSWPRLTDDQLHAWVTTGYQTDHLRFMAVLAARKFRLIRTAIDCLLGSLALVALTTLLVATA
ncbi:hypothetical protein KCMC57_up20950 [Kitasatospora sp. CMC57]|uniref:Pycsar effector protein domain-containing protein n=1 Tax=Kitasatospora sp. CMC57 TaxID=3231513 RepID=A0AB33JYX0_9ACTN